METGKLTKIEITTSLQESIRELEKLVQTCDELTLDQSLGEGKWSIKQLAGHLYDTEEVWSERIEQAISNDQTPFQSYDPEMYVKERAYERFNVQENKALIKRLKERRIRTLHLLEKDTWEQSGLHPEEGVMTVQILAETIALHEQHHLDQIKAIMSKSER
ncbi:DinB family protein [Bacillus pumilus]|uniref:DinB family protein n=1 Tax=Bacillus pumilus TaxID=1408 RepID=UPI000DDC357C|nr:DinB family protein [Bacillus pumilus]MCY7499902.1 DinB family protein [Bacillus pumilus]MCY7528775.1 DinB family protein [Bacillus pumilus]MED4439264.1 DinB family protein [Bacillus pumilus]MED4491656.1 DinB family protein [Bacillus pumilus]